MWLCRWSRRRRSLLLCRRRWSRRWRHSLTLLWRGLLRGCRTLLGIGRRARLRRTLRHGARIESWRRQCFVVFAFKGWRRAIAGAIRRPIRRRRIVARTAINRRLVIFDDGAGRRPIAGRPAVTRRRIRRTRIRRRVGLRRRGHAPRRWRRVAAEIEEPLIGKTGASAEHDLAPARAAAQHFDVAAAGDQQDHRRIEPRPTAHVHIGHRERGIGGARRHRQQRQHADATRQPH